MLTLVIVTFNRVDDVLRCLKSVYRFNDLGDALEVLVVDNTPSSEVRLAIAKEFPSVRVLENGNHGFGEANNRGVEQASSPYVLLLNPDTEIIEPIFRWAVRTFNSRKKLGAFGVQLVDKSLAKQMSFFWTRATGVIAGLLQHLANRFGWFASRLMCTSGADLFVRRETFLDVGGFDESMFLYNEEKYLHYQLMTQGWTWGFFSDRKIIHHENGSNINSSTAIAYRLESQKIRCQKTDSNHLKELRGSLRYIRARNLAKKVLSHEPDLRSERALMDAIVNIRSNDKDSSDRSLQDHTEQGTK